MPPLNPKWKDLLNPFYKEVWFGVVISLVASTLFFSTTGYIINIGLNSLDGPMYMVSILFDESHKFTHEMRYSLIPFTERFSAHIMN